MFQLHRSIKLAFASSCLLVCPSKVEVVSPKTRRTDSLTGRANTQSEHFGPTSRCQLSKYGSVSSAFRGKKSVAYSHLRTAVLITDCERNVLFSFFPDRQADCLSITSVFLVGFFVGLIPKFKLNSICLRIFNNSGIVFQYGRCIKLKYSLLN